MTTNTFYVSSDFILAIKLQATFLDLDVDVKPKFHKYLPSTKDLC